MQTHVAHKSVEAFTVQISIIARRLGLFLYVPDAWAPSDGIVERPGIHRDDARAAVQQALGPASGRRAEVQCPLASEVFNPCEVQCFREFEVGPGSDLLPARLRPVWRRNDAADVRPVDDRDVSLEVCLARRESVRRRALEASRDVRRQRRRRRPDADPRTGARGGVAEQLVDLISGRGDVGHWLVAIEREGHADASEHGVCRGLRGERCRVVRPQQQEALDADLLDRQRLVAARGESHRDAVRMAPWDDRASRDVA